jgi:hypothetical protein
MEKKNTNQHVGKIELVFTVGCHLIVLLASLIFISLLVIVGIWVFYLYIFGDATLSIVPFQDADSIIAIGLVLLALFACVWGAWKYAATSYGVVIRYRTMRQEKARIERLMTHDNIQSRSETDLLSAQDPTLQKEMNR